MFLWSMTNMGKVEIVGLDVTSSSSLMGKSDLNGTRRYDVILDLGYSYQYAVDRTDPKGKSYGHQIPYTPRHSGNISLTATTPWVDVGYSVMLVGKRYCMQQNTTANLVKGYVDQGITLTHEFDLGKSSLKAKVQVLNIFNVQYEVVRSYPMMGRNYRVGLTWTI
jgi:outer membrane cobalamin receptor